MTDLAGQSWPGDAPGLLAAADQETHTALSDLIGGRVVADDAQPLIR